MGLAIDTVASFVTAGATNPKVLATPTVSPGDSLQVRNFQAPAYARLEAILYDGTAKQQLRVESPMFHDDVTGLTFGSGEEPAQFLLPRVTGQPLTPGDTLTVLQGAAAGSSSIVGLVNYYSDLPGAAARLHMWGDISGIIASIKSWEVDVTTSGTIGTWTDTAINANDSQFHAGHDYAILGFQVDTAVAIVGVKGQETGNLRIGCPGTVETLDISDYFVTMSERHGTPHIPVFNADNKGAFYVSAVAKSASVATKVYVIAAELQHTITPLPGLRHGRRDHAPVTCRLPRYLPVRAISAAAVPSTEVT